MQTTSQTARPRLKFHPTAYQFVWQALQYTQKRLRRPAPRGLNDEDAHISGAELLEGIRLLAQEQFGLLAREGLLTVSSQVVMSLIGTTVETRLPPIE